jgi:hypothetical protein
MNEIHIAADFGGSGMKIVASCDDRVIAVAVSPQVSQISALPDPLDREFAIDLTKNLWISYGESSYALGDLAATRYYGTIPLREPKSTYIVPRTLGAIAIAAHRFGGSAKLDLKLQLLLPAAEYSKQEKTALLAQLQQAVKTFETPIGTIRGKITHFVAKPEGFGLMRRQMMIAGTDYQQQSIAVVMFGHRNTSLYLYAGGQQQQQYDRSNDIGFIRAIEAAKVDPVKAISNPKLVDPESIDIYWQANAEWLRENWPESAISAIIGGGPLAVVGDRAIAYLDKLMGINGNISINGGMPIAGYEETSCKNDTDCPPLLAAWPEEIGIDRSQRQQFADVYSIDLHYQRADRNC